MAKTVERQRGVLSTSAHSGNFQASNPLIGNATLKQIYATILQHSLLAQRLRSPIGQNKSIAKYANSFREEAAVVDAVVELRRDDWLAPPPGDVVAASFRGASLTEILSALHAHAAGPSTNAPAGRKSAPLNSLPPSATPAAQLALASGVAMAMKAKGKGSIVVALCGAAPAAGKTLQDALHFAGTHCLPLVIVSQARAPLVVSTRHKAGSSNLLSNGQSCGFPVIPVDAHDAVAMYRVTHESIHKARYGGGPTLIEATTFQKPAATQSSRPVDALTRMENYLAAKGIFSPAWKQNLVQKFNLDLDSAVEAVNRK